MHANVFDFSEMLAKSDKPYLEFLRAPSLSAGIYVLDAGATDTQTPHHEDEVYYVASGRAKMRAPNSPRARSSPRSLPPRFLHPQLSWRTERSHDATASDLGGTHEAHSDGDRGARPHR